MENKKKDFRSAEDILLDNGFEDVVIYNNYSYDTALIGVSSDNVAIYDYEKMVEYLMVYEGFSREDAVEWIDYNTMGAYIGDATPIIMFPLE